MLSETSSSFWTTLPGLITAVALLLTAITGFYVAVILPDNNNGNVTPTMTPTPPTPVPTDTTPDPTSPPPATPTPIPAERLWGPTEFVTAGTLAGGEQLLYGVPRGGDGVYLHEGAQQWIKVGGPGKMFALDNVGNLYGLSPDGGGVFRYTGTPMAPWTQVGGPAATIYAGGSALFATNPQSGDIYRYDGKLSPWERVGNPGRFAVDGNGRLFGVSPDGSSIRAYDAGSKTWQVIADQRIAGPIGELYAGGSSLYATMGSDADVYRDTGNPNAWIKIGEHGKMFAVDDSGALYRLSFDGSVIELYSAGTWTKVGEGAEKIFAGGSGRLFATQQGSGDLVGY